MLELVLCDEGVKIAIRQGQREAILIIAKDREVEFPLTKANLAAILDGETIQFSHRGIFCKLSRSEDKIHIVYAWKGAHNSADCPVSKIQALLATMAPGKSWSESQPAI